MDIPNGLGVEVESDTDADSSDNGIANLHLSEESTDDDSSSEVSDEYEFPPSSDEDEDEDEDADGEWMNDKEDKEEDDGEDDGGRFGWKEDDNMGQARNDYDANEAEEFMEARNLDEGNEGNFDGQVPMPTAGAVNDDNGGVHEVDASVFDGSSEAVTGEPVNSLLITPEMLVKMTPDVMYALEFRTLDDAIKFYVDYGNAHGFSTRLAQNRHDSTGKEVWRAVVCSKQGTRQRKYIELQNRKRKMRRLTRCECEAKCCIKYKKSTGYFVFSKIYDEHNHPLALDTHVPYFRVNRRMTKVDVETVMAMRDSNIGTSQAYEFMCTQRGGYRYIGFLPKDVYNKVDAWNRLKSMGGDADTLIRQMKQKRREDPGHRCFFKLNREGRLASVVWRDSQSLRDYCRFNDTLVFDSTYKTNMYGKPLVLFVGVNNHGASVLFACALIVDETTDTYVWLLSSFLRMMNGIRPASVLTDGDEAMRNAVVEVLPEATHRVCTWHVGRNVAGKIKDTEIVREFMTLIYRQMSISKFERRWSNLVRKIADGGARSTVMAWLDKMYQKRERWAEAFFSGKFFAMMTTTQRCEGLNKHLKRGLSRVSRIFEVPYRVSSAVYRMRQKSAKADFDSFNSKPVASDIMTAVDEQLGNRLTAHLYDIACTQIELVGKYNVIDDQYYKDSGFMSWVISEAYKEHRVWHVEFVDNTFSCTCGIFESYGIPCGHIYRAMSFSGMKELPEEMILPRWCKTTIADEIGAEKVVGAGNVGGCPRLLYHRSCAMNLLASSVISDGAQSIEGFMLVMHKLKRLKIRVEELREEEGEDSEGILEEEVGYDYKDGVVKDPLPYIPKDRKADKKKSGKGENSGKGGKGGKSGKRRSHCRICQEVGHNKKTCPQATAAEPAGVGGIPGPTTTIHRRDND